MKTSLVLIFLLLFPAMACAQAPIGAWELTNPNGSPIRPGWDVGIDIQVEDGGIVGRPWVNRGQGREELEEEVMTIHELGLSGTFEWINRRGHVGLLYYNFERLQWESEVILGPHAGTVRALR